MLPQLFTLIKQSACVHPLLIGVRAPKIVQRLRCENPPIRLNELTKLPEQKELIRLMAKHDWVYVAGSVLWVDQQVAEQRLAAMRDNCRGQIFVESHSDEAGLSFHQFLALGFQRLDLPASDDSAPFLYQYSIHTYKNAPDWLNSRFWANPERWNLD